MNRFTSLLVVALSVAPVISFAENPAKDQPRIDTPAKAAPQKKSPRPVRLSDAELDKITAGEALHLTGDGITFITNPGNSDAFHLNRRNIVCHNACL